MSENELFTTGSVARWVASCRTQLKAKPMSARTVLQAPFRKSTRTLLSLGAAGLVLAIEAVDYLAGAQTDLTILQAAPVLAVAVVCGRARALSVAALGATAWLGVHLASGLLYTHALGGVYGRHRVHVPFHPARDSPGPG